MLDALLVIPICFMYLMFFDIWADLYGKAYADSIMIYFSAAISGIWVGCLILGFNFAIGNGIIWGGIGCMAIGLYQLWNEIKGTVELAIYGGLFCFFVYHAAVIAN